MSMPIEVTHTDIPGLLVIKTNVFQDERGAFCESYSKRVWAEAGLAEDFVQDNLSYSRKGTLRGLHYQIPPQAMGKLIRCMHGAIYDVAVDLRSDSPTFGKHVGLELSADNRLALWVPQGFAHGFLALEENCCVHYKCTAYYAPECERSLHYADPALAIDWPAVPQIVSQKDQVAPPLGEAALF